MENNSTALSTAVKAIKSGEPVVYPTDTVYGLGVDASNSDAIERVFDIKGRNYDNPLSLAVQNISAVKRHAKPSERAIQFIQAFLPGPITVVVERSTTIPDVLTAGRNRVGIRIPDNDIALSLLKNVAPTPVTATSANQSGTGSIVHPDMLDQSIRENAAIVLDGGETTGTESTVVDPAENIIHRRGAMADAVIAWLSDIVGTRPMIES
ncbi:L-threonylcarbamoyladenylate synthase [Haloquadratum walsbyi]|jgi:Sua5/YciO/YrdC/YwlC family protein|nr:L-threonylcarbamoyladenylate synthase [Haloquadratum walsbyi]